MFKQVINQDKAELIDEMKGKFEDKKGNAIIYFVSPKFNLPKLALELNEAFPKSQLLGGTTAGEIGTGEMKNGSISAMELKKEDTGKLMYSVLDNKDTKKEVEKSFKKFADGFDTPMNEMDNKKYLGLVLLDGLSGKEENIMEQVNKKTNVIFAGGSTGDELEFKETAVLVNDKVHYNKSLLMLMKPNISFDILKTQSVKNMNINLKPTKVEGRTVKEFNNQPAIKVYKELTGVNQIEKAFMKSPIGLDYGNEIFIRSPQKISEDGEGIDFYCNVNEGLELNLLASGDIVSETKRALEEKKFQLGNIKGEIKGMINFHCILRTLQLENKGKIEEYAKLFDKPTLGFSTYGEVFLTPVNQTSVIIVFGE